MSLMNGVNGQNAVRHVVMEPEQECVNAKSVKTEC